MNEHAVRFGPSRCLVGVVTEPAPADRVVGAPAAVFLNAGLLPHAGPYDLHVQLARRLARQGIASLRFDLSGIGDSGARGDALPRAQSMVEETRQAFDLLRADHGVERFVLFGLCTGADQAVRVALDDPRVVGAVLVDGYAYATPRAMVRYHLARALRPASWWNVLSGRHPAYRRFAAKLRQRSAPPDPATNAPAAPRPGMYQRPPRDVAEARLFLLAERDCRLCCIFTPTPTFGRLAQFAEMFPSLANHPAVHVEFHEHANHVFTLRAARASLIDSVCRWFQSHPALGEALPSPAPRERIPGA